jgi:hypothetical protein
MHSSANADQGKTSKAAAHSKESVDGKKSARYFPAPVQKKEQRNETGMPDQLKSGLESLSGIDLSDVNVHYNSSRPSQFFAHSFAQGNEIHLSPGREKDLAHEGWHVVQQKQGRVQPSLQLNGLSINDNKGLETEADQMGAKAFSAPAATFQLKEQNSQQQPAQRVAQFNGWAEWLGQLVRDNPVAAISTGVIVTLASLALYYYNRNHQPQIIADEEEEEELDPDSLAGVARAIGVDPAVLRNQLENGAINAQAPVTVNQVTDVFVNPDPVLGLVPPSLIANLHGNDAANVNTIFQRINNYNFRYTGIGATAERGFLEKSGDCLTLARMFIYAIRAAGIDGADLDSDLNKMLVVPSAIHGRNRTGNLENDTYWFFYDHYWITFGGQTYDVLFMNNATPTTYAFQSTQTYNNVDYDVFAGGRCVVHAAEILRKRMGVPLGANTVGVSRNSIGAIQHFINQNPAT